MHYRFQEHKDSLNNKIESDNVEPQNNYNQLHVNTIV